MAIIGLDYTPAYEQGGGIGRYVRELTGALAQLDHSLEYRLFVAGAKPDQLPPRPGPNFMWCPTRISPRWLVRIWHRLHVPLPVERFTGPVRLFHATDFVLPPVQRQTRTLLTVHDLSFVQVPEAASPRLKAYLDWVVPLSVHRADHILADSVATKTDLMRLYNTPENKISVLLSGVDQRFRPASSNEVQRVRAKYDLDQRPYIFSLGTVQPRKNYSRLIQALQHLRQQGNDLHLVIAGGRGWLEDPIYQAIRETQMEAFVHFIGFAAEEDLNALYSGAVCFAFPSLYEGFGLPVLEAMACHTPVITSNISSLPEVAGDAAIMINPYNLDELTAGIARLIHDSDLRAQLIAAGQKRVQSFTWEQSAQQLVQIYHALLR